MAKTKTVKVGSRFFPYADIGKTINQINEYYEEFSPGTLKVDFVRVTLTNPGTGNPVVVRDYRNSSIHAILGDFCSLTEFERVFSNPAGMTVCKNGIVYLDEFDPTKASEKVDFFEALKHPIL